MKRLLLLALLCSIAACSGIQSSTVRTGTAIAPYRGAVQVAATGAVTGQELGVVQVMGPRAVDELMPEFKAKVAELGGNFGLVDKIASKFDMQTRTESYSYGCGTSSAPRTCTGTRTVTVEVMTVQLLGQAYRR